MAKSRLRRERQRLRLRAFRKARELRSVADRTGQIKPSDIILFSTLRNENIRLPYFLKYYRDLGVNHFIFVDNNSQDGGRKYLTEQGDVSVWSTSHSYKVARFGTDWLNRLLSKYGHGHWTLTVDVDEFLIFPFCDSRPLRALTDWLDVSDQHSFSAMLLDMYPKGALDAEPYMMGDDPIQNTPWFDSGNYTIHKNTRYNNLWIQGGPRARMFFTTQPELAPAMNKIPLVKWHRKYTFVSSTHMLLPAGLNKVYDTKGGEQISGCLLHAKFLDSFGTKAREELSRGEHYANSHEYKAYNKAMRKNPDMWCESSVKYTGWQQLEELGLISKGNWA